MTHNFPTRSQFAEVRHGFIEKTLKAIIANKLFPGYLDRYLAKHGFDSQQTNEPDAHDRATNLWNSVPGDFGGHGRFDAQAHPRSPQLWATTHRAWFGAAAIGVAAGAIGLAYTIRRWNSTRLLSALARTVLPQPLKWPAKVVQFASSKRGTRLAGARARQS